LGGATFLDLHCRLYDIALDAASLNSCARCQKWYCRGTMMLSCYKWTACNRCTMSY